MTTTPAADDPTSTAAATAAAERADSALINHWLDGRSVTRTPTRTGAVHDPASGTVIARVALAGPSEVDAAVEAAAAAFPKWRDTSLTRRARVLFRFRELLDARRHELAAIITREHGKVLDDALGEVARGLEVVEFACGLPHLLKGEFSQDVSTGVDAWSVRQPVGVAAAVTPFNFPVMVPLWTVPIALACGNAFVLKPSEKVPSAAMFIAELLREAGLPDGVFNVVHGDRGAVERLLAHPEVAAVSSVGSTPVARSIYETAAAHGKRVQALGGAKNHMVVLPDADLEWAADAAVSAAFGSAGQRCMAISALVAVGDVADPLADAVAKRMSELAVGPGTDPASQMGPVISAEARDRILAIMDEGVLDGATLRVDGRSVRVPGHEEGFWVGPSLFDHVRPEMSIHREEIFGPVLCILRVASYDDALALVNASPYANGTAIFTNDGAAARAYQRDVEVGMVGINVPIPVPMAFYSFGGWKQSLFGDAHVHGMEGVRFFTRMKSVTGRWPDPRRRQGVDLGFPTT